MKVRVSENVVCKDLAGEAVLLDLATGTYFGLNEVGTRIWHLIEEHGSIEPVVRTLLDEYDASEKQARADLDALIDQLRTKGLVRIDAEQASATG